jgi:hypothetical protein
LIEENSSLRRVDAGQLLAITALHPFVVDEESSGLNIFSAIGSSELNGEIRHPVCGAAAKSTDREVDSGNWSR